MHKMKFFVDIEKEENWLRSMSSEGWSFSRRGMFGYWFYRANQEEQIYRIDYRSFSKREDYEDYIYLFDDAGWDHIDGSRFSGYHYFASKQGNPDNDIFSDDAARNARYARLAKTWSCFLITYLALFIISIVNGSVDPQALLDPKSLYFTPGLWSREGLSFFASFLFETPFVIMRNAMWLFFPIMIALIIYYLIRIRLLGKQTA